MPKSTSATTADDVGNDDAREIDFADEIGVADNAVRCFAQNCREQKPRQHARKDHDRIGRGALARQVGEPAEHDRKHHHREKRANNRPGDADDGLLVADRDIAPSEDREQARDRPRCRASNAARPGPL